MYVGPLASDSQRQQLVTQSALLLPSRWTLSERACILIGALQEFWNYSAKNKTKQKLLQSWQIFTFIKIPLHLSKPVSMEQFRAEQVERTLIWLLILRYMQPLQCLHKREEKFSCSLKWFSNTWTDFPLF